MCISGWDGCGYYRIQVVAKYLNKIPGITVKVSNVVSKTEIRWCDIVVFQKLTNDKALPYYEYARSSGKKVVLEVDDDYFALEPHNPAYPYFGKVRDLLIKYYSMADAMSVTTEGLRRASLKFNPNIYVLPNSLDFRLIDKIHQYPEEKLLKPLNYITKEKVRISYDEVKKRTKDKILIGWGGSPTHLKDLYQVTPALQRICKENKNVMIVFLACVTDVLLETTPDDQILLLEPIPVHKYHHVLAAAGWDICICPVAGSLFNASKSNLKYAEFASNRYPTVCSDYETYNTTVIPNETGLLAQNNDQDWYDKIMALVNDVKLRKNLAEKGYNFVREHFNIEKNASLWLDAYREILGG